MSAPPPVVSFKKPEVEKETPREDVLKQDIRPEAIMLKIRELDSQMTGYREEKRAKELSLGKDKAELKDVCREIAILEKKVAEIESNIAAKKERRDGMSRDLSSSMTGVKSVNTDAEELLRNLNKRAGKIKALLDEGKSKEIPSRTIHPDTKLYLQRVYATQKK